MTPFFSSACHETRRRATGRGWKSCANFGVFSAYRARVERQIGGVLRWMLNRGKLRPVIMTTSTRTTRNTGWIVRNVIRVMRRGGRKEVYRWERRSTFVWPGSFVCLERKLSGGFELYSKRGNIYLSIFSLSIGWTFRWFDDLIPIFFLLPLARELFFREGCNTYISALSSKSSLRYFPLLS